MAPVLSAGTPADRLVWRIGVPITLLPKHFTCQGRLSPDHPLGTCNAIICPREDCLRVDVCGDCRMIVHLRRRAPHRHVYFTQRDRIVVSAVNMDTVGIVGGDIFFVECSKCGALLGLQFPPYADRLSLIENGRVVLRRLWDCVDIGSYKRVRDYLKARGADDDDDDDDDA